VKKIIAQCWVWNSAQFITAPIMRIHEYVDEIQVFDGAYQFMLDKGYAKVPWSTDGTEEIVKSLKVDCPIKWVACTKAYSHSVDKTLFSRSLEYWKRGEWTYLMSDDEIPSGNVEAAFTRVREEEKALVGYAPMVTLTHTSQFPGVSCRLEKGPFGRKPRFFKWQHRLHYKGNVLLNGEGQPRELWPKIMLDEITLVHLKHLRPKKRLQPQLDYEAYGEWRM